MPSGARVCLGQAASAAAPTTEPQASASPKKAARGRTAIAVKLRASAKNGSEQRNGCCLLGLALRRSRWLAAGLLVGGALAGCAKESGTRRGSAAATPTPTPAAWGLSVPRGRALPSGATCRARLRALGVEFERLGGKRGVDNPIRITSPIEGIRFLRGSRLEVTADCRLGLALVDVARVLKRWGAYEVRHFGAYSYRNTRSGRLSLHARGLAIDIRAVSFRQASHTQGTMQSVEDHFVRGLGGGCFADAPPLNQLACALRRLELFSEFITPDHNRDHHDHFHLALPR